MEKDQIFFLKDRGVIYINGKDAKEFLQNIITNDINKVGNTSSCFASLLTPQGKYLFDFVIIKHKQGYLLDCEKTQLNQLIERLNIYKLNSEIEILNLSNEFEVAVISREKFLTLGGAKDVEGSSINYNGDTVTLDPRSKELGGRLIANFEKINLSLKKLNLNSKNSKNYYSLSHKLGIPQVNTNKLQDKIFGLECNFEKLNGIDFKKGCYVGQENTARMKLKNKLKKTLLPVSFEGNISALSEITCKEKVVGKILIPGPYPFGLFKTDSSNINELVKEDLLSEKTKLKIINVLYT
tara:strand:- start:11 stop:898 length:888 start_codon:yes stop_codon:yes gene_type:complete